MRLFEEAPARAPWRCGSASMQTTSSDSGVTLNDIAYTGPEAAAGKFMRAFWQPVCESRRLEKAQALHVATFARRSCSIMSCSWRS